MQLASKVYELGDMAEFTEMVYQRGWTDGPPVFPPTDDKIMAMIEYVGRDPGEVVGVVPPGEGVATLEKIAINAVMAGCKPEYMPVVLTAVEALLDPAFELMRVQCTTGGPAPLAIISGPVVKKLGFNYGPGAFAGTGHRANSTIGRAIRLILWNIGLGRPGHLSQAAMASPSWYAHLIAERPRDDGNPWEEIHVTNGLKPEDSAVSMFPAVSDDQISIGAGLHSLDNVLYVIADSICELGKFRYASPKLFVINPQAARIFHENGYSKERLRDALIERSVRPVRDLKRSAPTSITHPYHWTKLVDSNDDDAMVPAMIGPEHLQIVVTGGMGSVASQNVLVNTLHGEMVTKKINWTWD